MERVLYGLHWKMAFIYLDDVIVFGATFIEELEHLEVVLQRFHTANLKLNPKKYVLFQCEVPFLEHIVGEEGVRAYPQKVAGTED